MDEGQISTAQSSNKRAVITVLGVVVVFIVAAGVWYIFIPPTTESARYDGRDSTPYAVLMQENQQFAIADQLYQQRRYSEARDAYMQSLAAAADSVQEGQIKFKIAATEEANGDYAAAIAHFKEIAANQSYSALMRAHAIERLAIIHYLHSYNNPSIDAEIFKDEPYRTFLLQADGNVNRALQSVFEYAIQLYPLGISLTRVAHQKALEARDLARSGGPQERVDELVAFIRDAMLKADIDIERVKDDPNAAGGVPPILTRQGMTVGLLSLIGRATVEDAEAKFQQAMNLRALEARGADAFDRFNYAAFLVQYTEDREDEIIALLAPYYEERETYTRTPVINFFRGERSRDVWAHDRLVDFANVDPEFKALLESLGWQEDDFS